MNNVAIDHAKDIMQSKKISEEIAGKLINRHPSVVTALLRGQRKDPGLLLKLINAISTL